jgi:hypothetical protein
MNIKKFITISSIVEVHDINSIGEINVATILVGEEITKEILRNFTKKTDKKANPKDSNGHIMPCNVSKSICHYANQCPDSSTPGTYFNTTSYSEAVKKSNGESVTLKKIKTVVKDIVEDRSRNLMLFGLQETAGEDLHTKVKEVFEELNEKPFFKAERVGNNITDRPVKVTLDSSSVVSDLLRKSKDLKRTDYDNVYLKPDRTQEQRKKHRELVAELKRNIQDSPDKHHFIKNGEVCHQDKVEQDEQANSAKSRSGLGVTKKKKTPRKLLPHHIAANRRPPLGYQSPVTTDSSDCDG